MDYDYIIATTGMYIGSILTTARKDSRKNASAFIGTSHPICQVELLVPVVAVVTVLHVALVATGKLQAEAAGILAFAK